MIGYRYNQKIGSEDMTTEIREIFFSLLRNALSGRRMTDEEKTDIKEKISPEVLNDLFGLADGQDLAHLIGYALINNALIGRGDEMYDGFYAAQFVAMCRYENINNAFVQAADRFESAQIEYLPLKGAVMRRYYPQPWMRTSCDIDVLVRPDDFESATDVLQNAGYEVIAHSSHDISFQVIGVHVELHYQLIEEKRLNKTFDILNTVWSHASSTKGYNFEMSDEFFYFYHVAHMAKHFLSGGCGIRPFIDLWILNNRSEFNVDKCSALLVDGGLKSFEKHAVRLCSVWFGGKPHDKITMAMENFIFNGSLYGTWDNYVGVHNAVKNGKWGYFLSRLWLPYNNLRIKYPSLDGKRILTPAYQVWRWIDALLHTRNKVCFELTKSNVISDDERQEMASMLKELGIKK